MVNQIRLLDLCCGAGGAAMGYYQAAQKMGIHITITGIDINEQPNYPFNFIKTDAVEYIKQFGKLYTHVHASPPCQKWSNSTALQRANGKEYPDIVDPIRNEMLKFGIPCIIENVLQAPIASDVILRGDMFGLKVLRKRKFELINWFMLKPGMPIKRGSVIEGDYVSVFGKAAWIKSGKMKVAGQKMPKFKKKTIMETWKYAMGIDWKISNKELSEAIPPAYTNYLGLEFLKQ